MKPAASYLWSSLRMITMFGRSGGTLVSAPPPASLPPLQDSRPATARMPSVRIENPDLAMKSHPVRVVRSRQPMEHPVSFRVARRAENYD